MDYKIVLKSRIRKVCSSGEAIKRSSLYQLRQILGFLFLVMAQQTEALHFASQQHAESEVSFQSSANLLIAFLCCMAPMVTPTLRPFVSKSLCMKLTETFFYLFLNTTSPPPPLCFFVSIYLIRVVMAPGIATDFYFD